MRLVFDLGEIVGESGASPDKLEVHGSLRLGERLEHAPESLNDGVVVGAVRIRSYRFEAFCINGLGSTDAIFDLLCVPVLQMTEVALDHGIDAFLDGSDLFHRFLESGFNDQRDEFFNVGLLDSTGGAIWAELYLISVGEAGGEVLTGNLLLKDYICERRSLVAQISEHLGGVSVNAFQIGQGHPLVQDLFPDCWR